MAPRIYRGIIGSESRNGCEEGKERIGTNDRKTRNKKVGTRSLCSSAEASGAVEKFRRSRIGTLVTFVVAASEWRRLCRPPRRTEFVACD